MFTPQQIDQISFRKARKGYDMEDVDEFLEPLTEDYVTLYKENALLKSKMRVLVSKLEEYRKNEASMKEAVANAKRTCEQMIQEAEIKCAQMAAAQASAPVAPAAVAEPAPLTPDSEALIAAENARVEEARKAANAKIEEIEDQIRACLQALARIKSANTPAEPVKAQAEAPVDDVAAQISQSLEALVGTTVDAAPKAEPKHPTTDTTTSRFANMNLHFGRNYEVDHK